MQTQNIKSNLTKWKLKISQFLQIFGPYEDLLSSLIMAGMFSKQIGKYAVAFNVSKALLNAATDINIPKIIKDMPNIETDIFGKELIDIMKKYQLGKSSGSWTMSEINNVRFYWYQLSPSNGIKIYSNDLNILKNKLTELIFLNAQGVFIEQNSTQPDISISLINSNIKHIGNVAKNIEDRLHKFNNSRTILLHGEPGTGKSTIAKWLASGSGKKFICASVRNLNIQNLLEILNFIDVDAIIIDDLDRFRNSEDLLSGLEQLKNKHKLIIATMNNYENVDSSLIRPGRFDDHFEINKLDEDFINLLLGNNLFKIPEEYYVELLNWPVAYITDFNDRFSILGIEEIDIEFNSLKIRLENQRKKYE